MKWVSFFSVEFKQSTRLLLVEKYTRENRQPIDRPHLYARFPVWEWTYGPSTYALYSILLFHLLFFCNFLNIFFNNFISFLFSITLRFKTFRHPINEKCAKSTKSKFCRQNIIRQLFHSHLHSFIFFHFRAVKFPDCTYVYCIYIYICTNYMI